MYEHDLQIKRMFDEVNAGVDRLAALHLKLCTRHSNSCLPNFNHTVEYHQCL